MSGSPHVWATGTDEARLGADRIALRLTVLDAQMNASGIENDPDVEPRHSPGRTAPNAELKR